MWLMIRKKFLPSALYVPQINFCPKESSHFCPSRSSSTRTGKKSPSRIFENSFETRKWTYKFYQGTGSSFQSALWRWIDWYSMLNNALFQIQMLHLWHFQILVCIGRRIFNAVEVRIWSYYSISFQFQNTYLC